MKEWLARLEAQWPSFKYLGFGCYYAWIFLCYNSSVLFPVSSNVAGFSAQSVMYLLSTLALSSVLIISALFHRKASTLVCKLPFVLLMGLLASVSTVLVELEIPQTASPLFYTGCITTGLCTAFIALRFGMLYSSMEAPKAMANVAGAFVFAGALYFIAAGLPREIGMWVTILLPFLAACCTATYIGHAEWAPSSTPSAEATDSNTAKEARKSSHLSFFVKLVISVGGFSTICGFYNGLGVNLNNITGQVVSPSTNAVMIFVVLIAAVVLLLLSGTIKDTFKVSKLYYPVILIACFAIVIFPLVGDYSDTQRILIGAMYNLFMMFVWCLLAHVANRTSLTPVFVFGWGRGASGLGTTVGWAASTLGAPSLANNMDNMLALSVVMAFILVVISMVVLKEGAIDAVLEGTTRKQVSTTQNAVGGIHNPYPWLSGAVGQMPVSAGSVFEHSNNPLTNTGEAGAVKAINASNPIIQKAGLSEREIEVLQLLVDGNTIDGIAEKLCVSFNTAKSHVRHVYTKLDVHSRKELLALLK